MTLFVFQKYPQNPIKMGKTVKNLDQFLTLDLDQFLKLETPNLGPVFNSTAYIYISLCLSPSVFFRCPAFSCLERSFGVHGVFPASTQKIQVLEAVWGFGVLRFHALVPRICLPSLFLIFFLWSVAAQNLYCCASGCSTNSEKEGFREQLALKVEVECHAWTYMWSTNVRSGIVLAKSDK